MLEIKILTRSFHFIQWINGKNVIIYPLEKSILFFITEYKYNCGWVPIKRFCMDFPKLRNEL
jgi:hypothetical protein